MTKMPQSWVRWRNARKRAMMAAGIDADAAISFVNKECAARFDLARDVGATAAKRAIVHLDGDTPRLEIREVDIPPQKLQSRARKIGAARRAVCVNLRNKL